MNLVDLYVAAGGTLSEDGQAVTISGKMEPFDIVLRVMVREIKVVHYGGDEDGSEVTLGILDVPMFRPSLGNTLLLTPQVDYITLPVSAIRLPSTSDGG